MKNTEFEAGTWIEPEEAVGFTNAMRRRGRARLEDGTLVAFRAGFPDTFFTIPAFTRDKKPGLPSYTKGFLFLKEGVLMFQPQKPEEEKNADPQRPVE